VDLVSPVGIFSEDGWGTDLEEALENKAPEEEFVDIEEILGPDTPTNGRNKGKQVENKPCVVTRSGRVIEVVNKDDF